MKIAELFAVINLKGGRETVATMQGLVKSSIALKAGLLAATTALYKMTEVARQAAVNMDMYQLNTGLSAQQLQQMAFKASQAGVSMQELGSAIQSLQQKNAQARLGYGWDPILTRFGVHPGQDPVAQLDKIGAALRRLQKSNPAEAKYLASKVGLSDNMYYAILKGSTEQMNKSLILTNKEQQALVKLNQQWSKFWFYIKQITVKIQALGAAFQGRVVRALTRALQGFFELYQRIMNVINANEKLRNAIIGVGIALAAAFAPELLLLSALVLILEDIFTYFEGGESITGQIMDWVNSIEEFKDLWETIKDVFNVFVEIIKMAIDGWKQLISILKETGFFEDMLKGICDMVKFLLDSLLALTKIPGVKWALNKAGYGHIADMADERLNKDMGFLGGISDRALGALGDTLAMPFLGPVGMATRALTQNNNTTVYVQSTGDASADAKMVGTWKNEISQANAQNADVEGGINGGMKYNRGR